MSKRRSTQGKRCERCRINKKLCFCDQIKVHDTKTRVSIIMHHREKHLTSNTAKLAILTLSNSKIYLRGLPEAPFAIEQLSLQNETTPLYLFPDADAQELNDVFLRENPGPYHLIIPDGTWSQAKKVRRREPGLVDLKCVKLPDHIQGQYKLRKGVREGGVCTFEAIIHALSVIEGIDLADDLLRQFNLLNDRVAKARSGDLETEN